MITTTKAGKTVGLAKIDKTLLGGASNNSQYAASGKLQIAGCYSQQRKTLE